MKKEFSIFVTFSLLPPCLNATKKLNAKWKIFMPAHEGIHAQPSTLIFTIHQTPRYHNNASSIRPSYK